MNKVIPLLRTELKIPSKSTLILSVSGGVDSMVMLSVLMKSTYKLVVVHFNHLKRDASVIEKDLVEAFCQKNEIPFHYYTISVKNGNFHHQAHQMRALFVSAMDRAFQGHRVPHVQIVKGDVVVAHEGQLGMLGHFFFDPISEGF